jgi:hypothetical protein
MNKSKYAGVIVMLILVPLSVLADPIEDSSMDGYKAGWYLNIHDNKLLTCPETCKASVNGLPESVSSSEVSKKAFLCKRSVKIGKEQKIKMWLYGNQFDDKNACYLLDQSGKRTASDKYYCLCVNKPGSQ